MRTCFICGSDQACGHREPAVSQAYRESRLRQETEINRLLENRERLEQEPPPRKPLALERTA